MKQYSHNYTPVQEAMDSLYSATRLMANECYAAALERINEARSILQQYLSQDNMVPDNDVADGWVRASDVENEFEELRKENQTLRKNLKGLQLVIDAMAETYSIK